MSEKEKTILSKIDAFKRKKIINLSLKGLILSLATIISIFILLNTLEFTFRFGVNTRTILFFSFLILTVGLFIQFIVKPLSNLFRLNKAINNEKAAKEIGSFFPEISDKLLNIIQLRLIHDNSDSLAYAGINQKIDELPTYRFEKAIAYSENKRFAIWLIIPLLILMAIFLIRPDLITKSTERITNYNKTFIPEAPFTFEIDNQELQAFKNEDFELTVFISGKNLPTDVYINDNGRKLKMLSNGGGSFSYLFPKVQHSKSFTLEAAGYYSESFELSVLTRPDLKTFNMYLEFPGYLKKKNERLSNIGNAKVPEGTKVRWQVNTTDTDSASIQFDNTNRPEDLQLTDNQLFELEKTIKNPLSYELILSNKASKNKDPIKYRIDVLKDQFPKINNTGYQDTVLFSYIGLGGNISDDYGLTKLRLFYAIGESSYSSINIPINREQNNQRYYYTWKIDSLATQGKDLKYYLQVWDNDGFNGNKATKTAVYNFNIPSKKKIKEAVDKVAEATKTDLDKTLNEAKELKEELEEAERKIKGKKELNWQDDRLIKDLIKRREMLNEAINELKEQNRNNESKRKRFTPQDEKLTEKVEQLQNLMDELLDEETKRLYDELKKLLEEESSVEDIQDLIEKINNKENNLEQELERTLELFKKMKFEFELNETINELKEQIDEQKEVQKKTENKERNNEQLSENQEDINKDFEELTEKLDQLEEQNQELKNPESLPDLSEDEQNIKDSQQESKELLDQKKNKKASEQQKESIKKMQEMAEKMEQMQASMEMEAMQENLEDLRAIVHNLLQLSFDQEALMNEFSEVKQSDPRFVELSQKQLKLKDDSQIVQDSLLALAQRVFQIASFVTREVTEMNSRMDKSVEYIKERRKPQAVSEQQFAMTSINNLALLLDDVLEQMQNAMADAMGKPQKNKGKQKTPSLSELQQQLNDQIEQLKGSGKEGRELSEELAKLAAEQERIRKALEEAQKKAGMQDGGNKPGGNIAKQMELTESDLVNKQLTEKLIKRQKDILTRLLESEDALRERDLDDERKGETADEYEKIIPKSFDEYFKLKEKEIELLKTIPPKLYPYYKNEVNEYFKRLENESSNIIPE